MTDPLRIVEHVACSPTHAFDTWTRRFSAWWPHAHSVSGDPAEVVLEPRLGGRIYERTRAGEEFEWGEITRWEPPDRLGYLWHIRRDRSQATRVEIHFAAVGDGTTRLEIVHSGWEALGDEAQSWRDANRGGWRGLLPHFSAAASRPVPDEGARP